MTNLTKLCRDFFGLMRVCGPIVAFRWILLVLLYSPLILRNGDLRLADEAMGNGPFKVTLKPYRCSFRVAGPQAISGIREMYVRDIYLRDGWLNVNRNATVLDLGANMGNFTNMVLAIEPTARVIAVEPSTALNHTFKSSVDLNVGHAGRVTLVRAFLGRPNSKIAEAIAEDDNYGDAKWITEGDLLSIENVQSVDLLKCDIEGGEYALLTTGSRLLALTKALACEVHAFAGDVSKFFSDVEASGFTIGPIQHAPDGSVIFLAKRNA
jgi:FkbM family methyltransferase